VVTYLATRDGVVAMVKVAALGVGHVTLRYLGEAPGDRRRALSRPLVREFSPGEAPRLRAGEEMASFGLGSTVVILAEPGQYVPLAGVADTAVRVGARVATNVSRGGAA
jgi:hypothetical protein